MNRAQSRIRREIRQEQCDLFKNVYYQNSIKANHTNARHLSSHTLIKQKYLRRYNIKIYLNCYENLICMRKILEYPGTFTLIKKRPVYARKMN